jgi:CysZ protein
MGVGDAAKKAAGAVVSAPKAVAVGFWRGLTYPFRGAKLVYLKEPGLVRYWMFPILITLIVIGFVFAGVWHYHDAAVDLFWAEPAGEELWDSVLRFLHGFVEILVALLLLVLGVVVVTFLSPIFAAPFNDALSEEVERLATGREGPGFSWSVVARDSVRTVLLEIAKLGLWAIVMLPLFVLSLVVPVVGQIVYTIFGFFFTAAYWSIDYLDWPASRRNRGIAYRFSMLREHFLPMLGFGTGVWLFLFVPLLNLLFMPAAVAGGTLLFLDLEGEAEAEAKEANSEAS